MIYFETLCRKRKVDDHTFLAYLCVQDLVNNFETSSLSIRRKQRHK